MTDRDSFFKYNLLCIPSLVLLEDNIFYYVNVIKKNILLFKFNIIIYLMNTNTIIKKNVTIHNFLENKLRFFLTSSKKN